MGEREKREGARCTLAEKREEEDAEEEEELIFPLWEKHMLDLKSWRESSHLALIGIKRVERKEEGGGSGKDERERDAMVVTNDLLSEMWTVFWWVLVVQNAQRIVFAAGSLALMSAGFNSAPINVVIGQVGREELGHLFRGETGKF